MKDMSNFIIVREYNAVPPLPEGEVRVELLKREAFDTTGYSFLRTNEVNGMDEWCPTDRLDHYRKEFNLPDDDAVVVYRLRTPPKEENT